MKIVAWYQGVNCVVCCGIYSLSSSLVTDVPMWLKSLRLHKYQALFDGCTYEQMLDIDESYLEEKVRQVYTLKKKNNIKNGGTFEVGF